MVDKRQRKIFFGVLILVLGAVALLAYYLIQHKTVPHPIRKITFATTPFIGNAPSYVAYHKGYFREEGLEVELRSNPGGWMNLKDLFEGRADIAVTAELPIIYSCFDKKKYTQTPREHFYIIGDMIYSQDTQKVVARKDRGILTPKDLKGKKVGVFRGTTLDYFMDGFLIDNRISPSEIEIVDMDVFKMTEAIVKGELDAIFTWQPHVMNALRALGDNGVVMESRTKFTTAWLIVVMKKFAQAQPDILERFLRAIVKAERFISYHPEQSIDIHSQLSKTDRSIVAALWKEQTYDLSLSEYLLTAMEAEARWLIRGKKYNQSDMPNFLDYILFAPMQNVKPKGVQIVR